MMRMEIHKIESEIHKLAQLEVQKEEAMNKYHILKDKINMCSDHDSEEYFQLSMARFNICSYIDMLEDKIMELINNGK